MLERRGRGEELPVALVREDRAPVGDVADGGERIGTDPRELDRLRVEPGVERDGRHEREERREQPARATHPEGPERDTSRGRLLAEQQRGDQVAGEDEEEIDPEVAAAQRAPRMEEEHAEQREPAQPVERGEVTDARAAFRGQAQSGRTIAGGGLPQQLNAGPQNVDARSALSSGAGIV